MNLQETERKDFYRRFKFPLEEATFIVLGATNIMT
jgi:hypothetical protein